MLWVEVIAHAKELISTSPLQFCFGWKTLDLVGKWWVVSSKRLYSSCVHHIDLTCCRYDRQNTVCFVWNGDESNVITVLKITIMAMFFFFIWVSVYFALDGSSVTLTDCAFSITLQPKYTYVGLEKYVVFLLSWYVLFFTSSVCLGKDCHLCYNSVTVHNIVWKWGLTQFCRVPYQAHIPG